MATALYHNILEHWESACPVNSARGAKIPVVRLSVGVFGCQTFTRGRGQSLVLSLFCGWCLGDAVASLIGQGELTCLSVTDSFKYFLCFVCSQYFKAEGVFLGAEAEVTRVLNSRDRMESVSRQWLLMKKQLKKKKKGRKGGKKKRTIGLTLKH